MHPARKSGIVARLFIAAITGYRYFISPIFPPACRFYPSCSVYTIEAIKQYGALRGFAKGVWRVLRCHPFARGGYDPVL